MFGSSWSAEDQQALEKIAEKIGVDLQAVDLAGEQASFASIEEAASKIGSRHPTNAIARPSSTVSHVPETVRRGSPPTHLEDCRRAHRVA